MATLLQLTALVASKPEHRLWLSYCKTVKRIESGLEDNQAQQLNNSLSNSSATSSHFDHGVTNEDGVLSNRLSAYCKDHLLLKVEYQSEESPLHIQTLQVEPVRLIQHGSHSYLELIP
jgi:predicted DNA-binding transcriptional regulator YafY